MPGGTAATKNWRQWALTNLRSAGLLARAECYRLAGRFDLARADLQEAREIAESGGMKLFLTDYHLESGRLCLAKGRAADAKQHFQAAAALIKETGYHRRDKEVIL